MGVDLEEKHRLDSERLSGQLAQMRARARPWRSVLALTLCAAAGIVSSAQNLSSFSEPGHTTAKLIAAACAAAFCVFGILAVFGLSSQARKVLEPRVGSAHAAVVRYSILLVGLVTVLVITLELYKIHIGQLVVGGALTGVVLGIAGQQTLANLFAGIVMLMSRPFNVGDKIRVRSGALAGQFEGTVTEIGIIYVRLDTGDGVLAVPNSQVLAAAVGPAPAQAPGQPG